MANSDPTLDFSLPPQSETTPYVPRGTAPATSGAPAGVSSTDLPAKTETKPYVSKDAQASSGEGSGSVAQAVGTGAIEGVPLGGDIAAAGVPLTKRYIAPALEAFARPINRFFGIDQDVEKQWQKASEAVPSSYLDAKARLKAANEAADKAHPWVQGAASLATGAAILPTAAPMEAVAARAAPYVSSLGRFAPLASRTIGSGAVSGGYGALYGAGEGDTLEDRARNALIGGATGTALGVAAQPLGEGLSWLTSPSGKAVDAANRQGIPLPQYVVSSPGVQRIGEVSKSFPLIGEMTRASSQHSTDAMNKMLESMSGGVTPEQAGQAARNGINDWFDKTTNMLNQRYAYLSRQLDQNVKTPLSATQQLINNMGVLPKARGSDLTGRAIDEVNKALGIPGGLSYDTIKDLRTTIDQLKGGWGNINPDPIDQARIKRLHGAISQDLDTSAQRSDITGQGYTTHQNVSRVYKTIADLKDDLTPIVGKQGDNAPEQVFNKLMNMTKPKTGDADLLTKARMAIRNSQNPAAWDTVEQGVINGLGRKPPAEPGGSSYFSPDLYVNHYSTNMSDSAKNVVFNPANRARLDDAGTISAQMQKAGFAKNTSGTSHALGWTGAVLAAPHIYHMIMANPYIGVPAAAAAAAGAHWLSRPVTGGAPSKWGTPYRNIARQAPIQFPYLTGQQQGQ